MKKLYVLHTGAGNEHKMIFQCQKNILQAGEDIFTPEVERVKKFGGVERTVWCNMYPGYVFVETDCPKEFFLRLRFGLGKAVFGYLQMLRNREYILPLKPEEEKMLRGLMDPQHHVLMSYGYMEGDQVFITEGPLKSFTGKVISINSHRRFAVIETTILGDVRKVVIGADVVRRADSVTILQKDAKGIETNTAAVAETKTEQKTEKRNEPVQSAAGTARKKHRKHTHRHRHRQHQQQLDRDHTEKGT